MKHQRESARVSVQELEQLIRINVWLYGKSFNQNYQGHTREEAMFNWLMRIGANSMRKEMRKRRPTELLPYDAKHSNTPLRKIEQREELDKMTKTVAIMFHLLNSRVSELSPEQQEIAQRIANGETSHEIYRNLLAKRAKTKASNVNHERVRGSREVRKVIRKLLKGPRARGK